MKIFVGNLGFQVSDSDLEQLFSEFGNVISAKVVIDNFSQRSRGYGFVEMGAEDARKAILKLDATLLHEKTLMVKEAIHINEKIS